MSYSAENRITITIRGNAGEQVLPVDQEDLVDLALVYTSHFLRLGVCQENQETQGALAVQVVLWVQQVQVSPLLQECW